MDFLSVSHSKTYDFIRLGCMSHRDYFNSFFFEFHSLNHFSYHHSVKSIFLVFKTEALTFILKSLLLVFYIKTKIWDWYENWQNLQFYVNYSFFFFFSIQFCCTKKSSSEILPNTLNNMKDERMCKWYSGELFLNTCRFGNILAWKWQRQ